MAGQLTIDTLKASTGVLATQNGMTGIAKAWVNYNGTTQTVNNSFNISSVTRNSAGDYTLNFATAMANANYTVAFGIGSQGTNDCRGTALIKTTVATSAPSLMTTTQLEFITGATHTTGISDWYTITATVFGS